MKKYLFIMMCSLLASGLAGCSSDDEGIDSTNSWLSETDKKAASDPNSIVGVWELYTLAYPGFDYEIPSGQRDLFEFNSKGQVKVAKGMRSFFPSFPNEDGEYDYSYNKEKRIIQLCGDARECVISDGEMHIDGYHEAASEPVQLFIFKKKQI